MRKVRLRELAETDLSGIWKYTFEQWDEVQADKCIDELDEGIRSLAANSELGTTRDYVRKGYRVLFVNRHAVYYTATPTVIHVIRVLHSQVDPEKHL